MPTNSVPAVSGCKLSFFMSFTPTKQQLEELKAEWFSPEWDEWNHSTTEWVFEITIPNSDFSICFYPDYIDNIDSFWYAISDWWNWEDMRFTVCDGYDDILLFVPESIDDIRTLIRILSPNN